MKLNSPFPKMGPVAFRFRFTLAVFTAVTFAVLSCAGTEAPTRSQAETRGSKSKKETTNSSGRNQTTKNRQSEEGFASNRNPKAKKPDGEGQETDDLENESIPKEDLNLNEVLQNLGEGQSQLKKVCSRPGKDTVRNAFCDRTPELTDLKGLQKLVGLAIVDPTSGSGQNGNPGFAFTAHSNALSARSVSVMNPRVILYSAGTGAITDYVVMGFVRGDQFVEMAARDPNSGEVSYYLLTYRQNCNFNDNCNFADLLTPATESGWTSYSLYEDVDLENTIYDCKVCHQPGGAQSPKMLRMQNLQLPWPHWFLDVGTVNVSPPGAPGISVPSNGKIPGVNAIDFNPNRSLITQFETAHRGDGAYGGIPIALARQSTPNDLATFIANQGFPAMPNETAETINTPIGPFPAILPGRSVGWQRAYELSATGDFIAVPYFGDTVADSAKVTSMTRQYQDVLDGTAPRDSMPDIREVFLENAASEMGFQVKPGLTGEGILQQACKPCHNSKLNQGISRAEFHTDWDSLNKETLNEAVRRIDLPDHKATLMPPRHFKVLTPEERRAATIFLQSLREP